MARTITIPARDETLSTQSFEGGVYAPGPLIWTESKRNTYTNPSFEATTGTSEYRRNLITTPTATSGFLAVPGTGGALTVSYLGGSNHPEVSTYARGTVSTATSSPSPVGLATTAANAPVSSSTIYSFQISGRTSKSSGVTSYLMEVKWFNGVGAQVGSTVQAATTPFRGANAWHTLIAANLQAPVGSSSVQVTAVAVLTANSVVGETYDATGVLVEASTISLPYFDGTNRPRTRVNYIHNPRGVGATGAWTANQAGSTTSLDPTVIRPGSTAAASIKGTTTVSQTFNVHQWTGSVDHHVPVVPGEWVSIGAWALSDEAVSASAVIRWRDSANAQVTQTVGPSTPITSWTHLTLSAQAPAGAVWAHVSFNLSNALSPSGAFWITDALAEKSASLGTYFDATTTTPGYGYGWQGTANSSPSYQYDADYSLLWTGTVNASAPVTLINPVTSVSGGNRSARWSHSGVYSARRTPTSTSNDTYIAVGADSGGLRLGMVPSGTYTAIAHMYLERPQTGTTAGARARNMVLFTKVGAGSYVETYSGQTPNVAGVYEHRITFTVPAGASEAFIRLYNGASLGGGDVWWDDFTIVEGVYSGPTFNPNIVPPTSTERYLWAGAVNGSESVYETGVEGPLVWASDLEGWSGSGVQSTSVQAYQGMYSMQVPTSASRGLTGLVIGDEYTLRAMAYNSGVSTTIGVGATTDVATPPANTWTEREVRFTADSSVMTASLSGSGSTLWDQVELVRHVPEKVAVIEGKTKGLAPEYRYFTVDLMTDQILAEIPFRGVQYECALKGAGRFSGRIPLTAETDSMDLYDSTMPGNTGLYVMRNGVCVWGGIIWSRNYQFTTKDLAVSASEFTSYFYHRKIWKTWTHQYGATVAWQEWTDLPWAEQRRNYSLNPSGISGGSLEDWGERWGFTTSYSGSGGPSGSSYIRFTSPTATSGASRGWDIFGNHQTGPLTTAQWKRLPVAQGDPISLSVWVRASKATSFDIQGRIHNGSGAWVSPAAFSLSSTSTAVAANTWTEIKVTTTMPDTGFLSFGVYSGTVSWAIGDTIDGASVLIEKTTTPGTFFTGATSSIDGEDYIWEGAANASNSIFTKAIGQRSFKVVFDNGSDVLPKPGSTVKLEFYEPDNFRYNSTYRVLENPAPTSSEFYIFPAYEISEIISSSATATHDTFHTKAAHNFETGDNLFFRQVSNNGHVIEGGIEWWNVADIQPGMDAYTFRTAGGNLYATAAEYPMSATVGKALPQTSYANVTVTVRMDAYDYIRTLIDAMFDDFVGTDFPNVYIEPGISYAYDVVSKRADSGYATIETSVPHNLAVGQALQVQDVGQGFDGEFEVFATPSATAVVYRGVGSVAPTAVAPTTAVITQIMMDNGMARMTTQAAHGFYPGQHVTVEIGDAYQDFSGTWVIVDVPTSTTFRYQTGSGKSVPVVALPNASITNGVTPNQVRNVMVYNNLVEMTLADPVTYTIGSNVTVSGVKRTLQITEKSLDAPNSVATIRTAVDHGLKVGDSITINGLEDSVHATTRTINGSTVVLRTDKPHNFRVGASVSIRGVDNNTIINKKLDANVATLTTQHPHSLAVGAEVFVTGVNDSVGIARTELLNGVAKITTSAAHNFQVNDEVTIAGLSDSYALVSKEIQDGLVILTTSIPHNFLIGQKISVAGAGVPFDTATTEIQDATATRIMYNVDEGHKDAAQRNLVAANQSGNQSNISAARAQVDRTITFPPSKASGSATALEGYYTGTFVVSARTNTTLSYWRGGEDQPVRTAPSGGSVTGPSPLNGTYTTTASSGSTLSFARTANNIPSTAIPLPVKDDEVPANVAAVTANDGVRTITAITPTSISFTQAGLSASSRPVDVYIRKSSIFTGTVTITSVPGTDLLSYSLPGYSANVVEEAVTNLAYLDASIYDGTYTLYNVQTNTNTVIYAKTLNTYPVMSVVSRGKADVRPVGIVSTFGPFPGNADIKFLYGKNSYTGVNLEPITYRGFELKSVGEALDAYSDNINGFEYRVDCAFDDSQDKFTKTFVMIPINFPDPPAVGEVSPLTRFGADKLVFEYPGGNISDVVIDESAEESATRFFAIGTTDLGPEYGPNIGIASSNELLRGDQGRKWPLLDASEQIDGVEDEGELYAHAQRYLSETAPPYTTMSVSLNGSIAPYVGQYRPGDWCSLILNDPFARMRLANALEPRTDVIVRKITGYTVRVPDGVTFPETVTLDLVAEWEVDKRG